MPTCKRCYHDLSESHFARLDTSPTGLHPYCDACLRRYPGANRALCRGCGANRLLSKFPGVDTTRLCVVCEPPASQGNTSDVTLLLRNGGLRNGGPCRTVTEILADLGMTQPGKAAMNAAAKWLRDTGFQEIRTGGRKGFRVSVTGEGPDNSFRHWVETYHALAGLALSHNDVDRYMAGVEPPRSVRLAMSALIAGLPPYEE